MIISHEINRNLFRLAKRTKQTNKNNNNKTFMWHFWFHMLFEWHCFQLSWLYIETHNCKNLAKIVKQFVFPRSVCVRAFLPLFFAMYAEPGIVGIKTTSALSYYVRRKGKKPTTTTIHTRLRALLCTVLISLMIRIYVCSE